MNKHFKTKVELKVKHGIVLYTKEAENIYAGYTLCIKRRKHSANSNTTQKE